MGNSNVSYSEKVMQHFVHPHNMGEMKDPDGIGKAGNPICLPPGELIQINAELKNVEEIQTGGSVLSHDGYFHSVEKRFVRDYIGKLVEIKNRFGTTRLTPEHMILAIRIPKTNSFRYLRNRQKLKHDWYHAEELEKGDIVLYPVMNETRSAEVITHSNEKKKYDFKSRTIPNIIKVNEEFLKFCGYYLAEGSLREKRSKTDLTFTFGIHETQFAKEVATITKKIFGVDAKIHINDLRHTIVVTINSVMVVRLFKKLLGDHKAREKSIPEWMLFLDPAKQKSLIAGLWLGDGFINLKKPRAGYATISPKLCNQLKLLLLRQNIVPSIYVEDERITKGVRHRKAYRIHLGQKDTIKLAKLIGVQVTSTRAERNEAWCDGKFAYVPITKVSKINYIGPVHNFEISDSHSYTTGSCIVHNCGDVMVLQIKVKNNKITDIKFRTLGCAAAISTSSMVTDLAKGKTIDEALKITNARVAEALEGLPPIKMHCSVLAEQALQSAIEDYKKKKGNAPEKKTTVKPVSKKTKPNSSKKRKK